MANRRSDVAPRQYSEAYELLNGLPAQAAHAALFTCCGSHRWAQRVLAQRPFASNAQLFAMADTVWRELAADDYLEAFSHHPEIGMERAALEKRFGATASLAASEQSGVAGADPQTLDELAELNRRYKTRFGFIFIICATGKSVREILTQLKHRIDNSPEAELTVAAGEQAKITRLRLERLTTMP